MIPVHGLRADGSCTCRLGGRCPDKLRGKHPVRSKWQESHRYSTADVMAEWDPAAGGDPDLNIGILTGVASASGLPFFVLDVDPDADGLAELARLTNQHGVLPETRTVRTGSGGRHYYFLVPAGMTIRNNQKRIAPGIDIRGTGGMVVAPPSVSGKGTYELVADVAVAPAPAWLVDLLTVPEGYDLGPVIPAEDLPGWDELDSDAQERVTRFAQAALAGAVRDYENAPPGRGNDQLYRSACAALEIVQSPWNLLTMDDVVRALDAARERRITARGAGGGQSPEEFRQTIISARNRVVGQGRPLPPDPHAGLGFDGELVDSFLERRAAASLDAGLETGLATMERGSALERLRARLHNRSGLEGIQPPTPLIERIIDVGTMVVLAGQFGTFKSFATIGWACAVATGTAWLGFRVPRARPVLYVAAEGASGLKLRVAAWERRAGVRVPDDMLWVLDVPVNLGDDDQCRALMVLARECDAGLVIFDTLHRVTAGLDENSSRDMHRVTLMADALRETLGATTVYAHHTGHGGGRSRGASSIEDDADAVWVTRLMGDEGRDPTKPRRFEQRKTKDAALVEPFNVKLDLVDGTDSGVLVPVDAAGNPIPETSLADPFTQPVALTAEQRDERDRVLDGQKTENAALVLDMIRDGWRESGAEFTKAAVKALCVKEYAARPGWGTSGKDKTFQRAWDRLEALNVVEATTAARYRYVPVDDRQPLPGARQTLQEGAGGA